MTAGKVEVGEDGLPILFAIRKPGQVAAQPDPSGVVAVRGASSGNTRFDPVTGRFAGGESTRTTEVVAQTQRTVPQGVAQDQWERRLDTIRDAAREMDSMDAGDAKEFLRGRPNIDAAKVNIDLFLQDVRAQRLDDLADILDAQLRTKVAGMRRSRRFVRLAAPKGWVTRVFAGLDDDEVVKLSKRLEGRGWDARDVSQYVIGRIKNEERRTQLQQIFGQPTPRSGRRSRANG